MQFGMLGLGRMGAGISRRALHAGHHVVGYDLDSTRAHELRGSGASFASDLRMFVGLLERPRTVWVMLPAGATGAAITELADLLDPGDVVLDGGNTHYHHDLVRAQALAVKGIHLLDIGTSGGTHGEERGYCLMVGGDQEQVHRLSPLFESIAPGFDAAPRSSGIEGPPASWEQGYLHCGPIGAGHFVKMIHNGIEYGAMAALAEGLNILHNADAGRRATEDFSAETTPLENPEHFLYSFQVEQIVELWRRGSVVSSWLLDLMAGELHADPSLESFAGRVSDSGEGRWALSAAIAEGVPAPILAAALFGRFSSKGEARFADQALSAMRRAMGGHAELAGRDSSSLGA